MERLPTLAGAKKTTTHRGGLQFLRGIRLIFLFEPGGDGGQVPFDLNTFPFSTVTVAWEGSGKV